MITKEQLAKLGIEEKWLEPLNETFEKYEINTPKRMAAFIGQITLLWEQKPSIEIEHYLRIAGDDLLQAK